MSYRVPSLLLLIGLSGNAGAEPPKRLAPPADWLADADAAARPVTYAALPLPPAAVGSVACVALVIGLRFTRHRRWVTLR